MKKVLEMVFRTTGGKEVIFALPDPKDNLDAQEVVLAMEDIITQNIFATTSGDLRDPVAARIRVTDTTILV